MPKHDFSSLKERLLAAGLAHDYVSRATEELEEHFLDLVDEFAAAGLPAGEAERRAAAELGSLTDLGEVLAAQQDRLAWYYRWPLAGRVALPLACVAAIPTLPLLAGYRHAGVLLRWGLCFLLSGLFTATLLAALQYSITLS